MIIESKEDISFALGELAKIDQGLIPIIDCIDEVPLRRNAGGFAGLARIIIAQQVSVASANAIWQRFETAFAPLDPQKIKALRVEDLQAVGLSKPKIRTLFAMSQALLDGLDLQQLSAMSAEAARAKLIEIKGIGPWTADIYLMFCIGHRDIFASGDIALQQAAAWILDLEERPDARAVSQIAERWSPWRAVAARLLWAYYAYRKQGRDGLGL